MRSLSSSMTFFYKYIFSGVWIGGFGLGTIVGLFASDDGSSRIGLDFLFIWIFGSAFILLTVGRIKQVRLVDDTKLIVSNFVRSQKYNVSNIVSVSGSLMLAPELVWFTVKNQDGHNKLVVLMPPWRFIMGFSLHPLVRELRMLAGLE